MGKLLVAWKARSWVERSVHLWVESMEYYLAAMKADEMVALMEKNSAD